MDPPDCQECGACCLSSQPDYIRVFDVDLRRMTRSARALVDGGAMRFEAGRCVALVVEGGRSACTIHPVRPDACRWLERGSAECLRQIADNGPLGLRRGGSAPPLGGA